MSIVRRFLNIYKWRDVRLLIFVNFLISLVLFMLDTPWNQPALIWLKQAFYIFIVVQCIGFSIFTSSSTLPLDRIPHWLIRWPASILSVLLSGWFGYSLGFLLLHLFFGVPLSLPGSTRHIVLLSSQFIVFGMLAYGFFTLQITIRTYIQKLTEKEIQAEKLERLKIRAELNALRAQVNPHFLFNTLNSIVSLIPVDPAKAEEVTSQLSDLFRYTLQVADEVPIQEELKVVSEYLAIEKVRLGNRLTYRIDCGSPSEDVKIPGLLIQPLVENSIKHGIAPLPGGGKVTVSCTRINGYCVIQVKDNGSGFAPGYHENFGLRGVRERLDLMYGKDHAFSIENMDGVTITIRIPVQIKDES